MREWNEEGGGEGGRNTQLEPVKEDPVVESPKVKRGGQVACSSLATGIGV